MLACDFCGEKIILEPDEDTPYTIEIFAPHTKGSLVGVSLERYEVHEGCAKEFADKYGRHEEGRDDANHEEETEDEGYKLPSQTYSMF